MFNHFRSLVVTLAVLVTAVSSILATPGRSLAKSNSQVLWGCASVEPNYGDDFGCPQSVDIVTSPWILTDYQSYHTDWLNIFNQPANSPKLPYIHTYIIAGMARRDWNLQDCNVDPVNNLCFKGSSYIRSNQQSILNQYQLVASNIKNNLSTNDVYIHVEPDFFQYTYSSQESPLSFSDSWELMNKITSIIRSQLPSAKLVLDISSWNYSLSSWCSGFQNFDYGGLVGKVFDANSDPDGQSYDKIASDCNKELIINTAHGVGGYFNSYNSSWEGNNNNAHAIIQSPVESLRYESFLQSIPGSNSVPEEDPINNGSNNQATNSSALPVYNPTNSRINRNNGQAPISFFNEPPQDQLEVEQPRQKTNIDGVDYYSTDELQNLIQQLERAD